MVVKILLFVLLNLLQHFYIECKSKLISVFQLNRHGARTPKAFEDRQKRLFFGSQNMQLTINGYRQEQLLGASIREKYVEKYKFLSAEYKEDEFFLLSSPTQRTIFSGAAFLNGLYPKEIIKFKYLDFSKNQDEKENIKNKDDKCEDKGKKKKLTQNSLSNITIRTEKNLKNAEVEYSKVNNYKIKQEKNLENNYGITATSFINIMSDEKYNIKNLRFKEIKRQIKKFPSVGDNDKREEKTKKNIDDITKKNINSNNQKSNNINKFFTNKKAKLSDLFNIDILNLKNEDEIPQLYDFTDKEKKGTSFLSLSNSVKEIPLHIINPLNDRLFHGWKCNYKGKIMLHNLKNLNPIFELTEEEILSALADFEKLLSFSETDFPESKFTNKNDKLLAITKYYMSYKYHFKINQSPAISSDTYRTFKRFLINDWYSVLNSKNQFEISIPISEFFNELLKHFNEGIRFNDNNKANQDEKKNENKEKKKYNKYKVFSGHDTILVNMLISLLDKSYIKENLRRALDDDNIFSFFIPEFGSYIIFELHYEESEKYYFVKIIYNGITIYNGLKTINITQEKDKFFEEISYERFEDLLYGLINKEYKKLDCRNELK